jgi:hypothetical protein
LAALLPDPFQRKKSELFISWNISGAVVAWWVANWPFNEITAIEQPDAIKCYPHYLLCDIAITFTLYKKEAEQDKVLQV